MTAFSGAERIAYNARMAEPPKRPSELWVMMSAAGLGLSMWGGAALASFSLLCWPSIAEISAAKIITGAIAGAIVWKAGQRLLRK